MKRFSTLKIFLLAAAFTVLCAAGYLKRGDYFHKQTDQFYYLALADSLRTTGEMKQRIEPTEYSSITPNTGAVWVLLPFSKFRSDVTFTIVTCIYAILNILSLYPVFQLLLYWGMEASQAKVLTVLYFLSFPVTLFRLWPVNEGPSFFLLWWFCFLILIRPGNYLYFLPATLGPVFRPHIFLVEGTLALFALTFKEKKLLFRTVASAAVSGLSILVYLHTFPISYDMKVGQQYSGLGSLRTLIGGLCQAITYLFVPESVVDTLLGQLAQSAATWAGLVLLTSIGCGIFFCYKKNKKFVVFGGVLLIASTISFFLAPFPLARFYTLAFLFALTFLWSFAKQLKTEKAFVLSFIAFNFILSLVFLTTKSTDPNYEQFETVRKLSEKSELAPVVYFEKGFPIKHRQLYGLFRTPIDARPEAFHGSFIFLSHLPVDTREFMNCRTRRNQIDLITMIEGTCL